MKKTHLRILSYNIHKGFTSGNRRFVLGKMRDAIREVHADLVFLQEVQGEHELHRQKYEDWPEGSQFEFLADEIWPHFAYGKNAIYSSGHHGNAILSKYPIEFSENIDVSTNRLEQRGILHATIRLPDRSEPVHAVCVHLGLFEGERDSQVKQLCARIESHVPRGQPLIIAGDFNDWRGIITKGLEETLEVSEAFKKLHGSHAGSFPSWFPAWLPAFRLDRVYFRGLEVKDAETLVRPAWQQLSDHAALYVELVLS